MKRKIAALILTAVMTASAAGCLETDKKTGDSGSQPAGTSAPVHTEPVTNENGEEMSESMELMNLKFSDVPDAESGPVIKLSKTDAKPGEIAEVTVSVTGADEKWNMCGIHITYPDVLECQLLDEKELLAEYDLGDAAEFNAGFVAMDWQNNLAEELVREKKRSVFFTAMFQDNGGQDGDIVTFYFKVPDDAQPGTVYPLSYFYMESDMFRNLENDMSFEKYAFKHLQNGSITVR